MFISKILEKKKQLTVCVFSYEELPAGAVASFFRFGAAGYLDIRQGLESVHEGIKKILRGYTFVPERYRECVEKTVEEYYDGDALLTSEYWLCRLICFGFELESCAEIMKVKLSTARFYKAQVYKKLNVHNTSSLVEKCRQLGIVKPDDIFENILSDDELKSIYKRRDKIAGEKQLRNYAAAS
jgi:DNA-binding NarL/FixJ family response regulator